MVFLEKYVNDIFKSLDNEKLVSVFIESDDEFTKNTLFNIILKRELDFKIWHRLYSHERLEIGLRANRRWNAFFVKMGKTAKSFTDHENICSFFGKSENWNCVRIEAKSYKILQKLATHFGEYEIVCKLALVRLDYKTASTFVQRMYGRAVSYAQYWTVSYFYRKIHRGNRNCEFENLLIERMNETAISFDDWAGVCQFSNEYNLGYGKIAFNNMLEEEEAKVIEGQESIYYAVNPHFCELPKELEWVSEANILVVGNMSKMANSYDNWKMLLVVSGYPNPGIKWKSDYIELSISNMVESLTESQPENEFRQCCNLATEIKNHTLLKKVLRKYLDIYGYDLDVINYVSKMSESILGKNLKEILSIV